MNWEFVVTIIVAVGFGIATLVLGIKRAKKKKPVWGYDETKIIGLGSKAPPEVKLSFAGEEVTDVYRTVVIFFNKGNEPIGEKDVAKRIVVDFGKGKILREPALVSVSKEENNFSAKIVEDNGIELGFNYLGHSDGACIEVLHTRGSPPLMSGTVIDTPIKEIRGFSEDIESSGITRTIICGVAVVGLVVYFGIQLYYAVSADANWGLYPMIASGVIFVILITILEYDLPRVIRALKFPYWGRDISKKIVRNKTTGMGGRMFTRCPKCSKEVEITGVKPVKIRGGLTALTGACPECGTMIYLVGDEKGGN